MRMELMSFPQDEKALYGSLAVRRVETLSEAV
jgi:hypothetical protein